MNATFARPSTSAKRVITAPPAKYRTGFAYVVFPQGVETHPVIIRAKDGLMLPCTHNPNGKGATALPSNWLRDGNTSRAWAKPAHLGRYTLTPRTLRQGTRPLAADVVAIADKCFG